MYSVCTCVHICLCLYIYWCLCEYECVCILIHICLCLRLSVYMPLCMNVYDQCNMYLIKDHSWVNSPHIIQLVLYGLCGRLWFRLLIIAHHNVTFSLLLWAQSHCILNIHYLHCFSLVSPGMASHSSPLSPDEITRVVYYLDKDDTPYRTSIPKRLVWVWCVALKPPCIVWYLLAYRQSL